MLTTVSICLIIVSLLFFLFSWILSKKTHSINKEIDKQNEELDHHNKYLVREHQRLTQLQEELSKKVEQNQEILTKWDHDVELKKLELNNYENQLSNIQNNITKTIDNQEELSQKAFKNYCNILNKQYYEAEEEYNQYKDTMESAYSDLQLELLKKIDEVKEELAQIEATRAAAIQAQMKEKEIAENKDNFRLDLSEANLKDIRLLKSIQPSITNAIVIDKIIWSNYYQPIAKVKFPKIIGKPTACGIYKITSLTTGLVYIGQSNDCCDRWKQHCKNALGVGTVTTENKLYKTMREEGLHNFTFEMLEECDRNLLDEKEKYYINLYKAYDYGLNATRGNG